MSTIKRIRGVSNDLKDKKLALVLESLDKDCDGKIDDLNDVLKVITSIVLSLTMFYNVVFFYYN
jgi:hypothetical protein